MYKRDQHFYFLSQAGSKPLTNTTPPKPVRSWPTWSTNCPSILAGSSSGPRSRSSPCGGPSSLSRSSRRWRLWSRTASSRSWPEVGSWTTRPTRSTTQSSSSSFSGTSGLGWTSIISRSKPSFVHQTK